MTPSLTDHNPPPPHRVPELTNLDDHIRFVLSGYGAFDIIADGRIVAHTIFKAAGWCPTLTTEQISDWKSDSQLLENQRVWETVWIGQFDKEVPYFITENALKRHILTELWAQEEAVVTAIEEKLTAPRPPSWNELFHLAKNGHTILSALFTNHPDTDDRA